MKSKENVAPPFMGGAWPCHPSADPATVERRWRLRPAGGFFGAGDDGVVVGVIGDLGYVLRVANRSGAIHHEYGTALDAQVGQ